MKTVTVSGYLVQSKLADALKEIVGRENWKGSEIPVLGSRRRWDMGFEIDGKVTVVEFDGDEHYRHTIKIKADQEKDRIAAENGITVVRVPYWVQLTTETLTHYFQLAAIIVQDFPHGFISTKIFPASYCPLGLDRFMRELNTLPANVRSAVMRSLKDRVKEHGIQFVVPDSLRHAL